MEAVNRNENGMASKNRRRRGRNQNARRRLNPYSKKESKEIHNDNNVQQDENQNDASSIFKLPNIYDCSQDFFKNFCLRPTEVLSQGMCGPVVLAKPMMQGQSCRVVKMFPILGKSKQRVKEITDSFHKDASVMTSLSRPHLVPDVIAARCPGYLAISMPHYANETLQEVLDNPVLPLSSDTVRLYTVQLACTVRFLHDKRLFHGDIKPDNLLMDDRKNLVLTDFGLSKFLEGTTGQLVQRVNGGTPPYLSPEAHRAGPLDAFKIDAYAIGVVVWSMVMWKDPSDQEQTDPLTLLKITTATTDDQSSSSPVLDSIFRNILEHLLSPDLTDRWTVHSLCDHLEQVWPYLKSLIQSL